MTDHEKQLAEMLALSMQAELRQEVLRLWAMLDSRNAKIKKLESTLNYLLTECQKKGIEIQ